MMLRSASALPLNQRKLKSPIAIMFTGLSAAGKTTLAHDLAGRLKADGIRTVLLDPSTLRQKPKVPVPMSLTDHKWVVSGLIEAGALLARGSVVPILCCIFPTRAERVAVRRKFQSIALFEVYVCTSLEVCQARDPKGLYAMALEGQIKGLPGLDVCYEPPQHADLIIQTAERSVRDCANELYGSWLKWLADQLQ